ncbi:unnamed protein product [Lampetra planeri]
MEVQSECAEPPVAPQCDPQPTGKINKAAFKLFGKRRTGSGMASFFSFRNKGATINGSNGNSDNGNSVNGNGSALSVELVRSKTHDGLTSANNDADGQRGEGLTGLEAGPPHPSLTTPPLDRCSTGDPPSEPSVDRLCSLLFNDVTSLKSFDSLTGCGDIIADADEEGAAGNGGSGTSSSSSGGGGGTMGASVGRVVAYMGGGEEMASPEGVDDADMQGLWHMLPSAGDNSPALPRSHQPSSSAHISTYPPRATSNPASSHLPSATVDRKVPQVKALGLSKIPVVGGAGGRAAKTPMPHTHNRHPTSPGEKEPLSDEGYWDTPSATPTATPDGSGQQHKQKMALSRDSCSGDHLYDLYNDPEEEGEDEQEGDGDLNSIPSPSSEYKLSPTSQTTPPSSSSSSSFRSIKGSASLPRDSKIPVSSKPTTPPASQSALSSVLEAESSLPKTQAPPSARTRIPVSKVPVRRSGNKPGSTNRGTASKK